MIIINTALNGENTYDISLSKNATYRVSAFDLGTAIDIVANYVEEHEAKDLYIDAYTLKIMAECSQYQTAEAFADVHKLTKCGTNGIYLEITNVKGCPNG